VLRIVYHLFVLLAAFFGYITLPIALEAYGVPRYLSVIIVSILISVIVVVAIIGLFLGFYLPRRQKIYELSDSYAEKLSIKQKTLKLILSVIGLLIILGLIVYFKDIIRRSFEIAHDGNFSVAIIMILFSFCASTFIYNEISRSVKISNFLLPLFIMIFVAFGLDIFPYFDRSKVLFVLVGIILLFSYFVVRSMNKASSSPEPFIYFISLSVMFFVNGVRNDFLILSAMCSGLIVSMTYFEESATGVLDRRKLLFGMAPLVWTIVYCIYCIREECIIKFYRNYISSVMLVKYKAFIYI